MLLQLRPAEWMTFCPIKRLLLALTHGTRVCLRRADKRRKIAGTNYVKTRSVGFGLPLKLSWWSPEGRTAEARVNSRRWASTSERAFELACCASTYRRAVLAYLAGLRVFV